MSDSYRLTWSMLSTHRVAELQAAGVPVDQVPESDWRRVQRIATVEESIIDQARRLQQWAADQTEYVRDVVLEHRTADGSWEEVSIEAVSEL